QRRLHNPGALRDPGALPPRPTLVEPVRWPVVQAAGRRDNRHQRPRRGPGRAPRSPRTHPGPRAAPALPRKELDVTHESVRKTALVAGVLYLITFAASIPAVLLLQPVLTDPRYVVGTGSDGRVIAGAFLDLVNALACIGTAVALFSVVKRQHEGLALGF